MSEISTEFHEKIQYVECPCSNIPASKKFFEKVFKWEFTDYSEEYSAFKHSGLEGGFFTSEQHAQTQNGSALIVFYSRDLEQTLKKVLDHGGHLAQEIFHFPGGRRFHFLDPSQNEFAVWSDREPVLRSTISNI